MFRGIQRALESIVALSKVRNEVLAAINLNLAVCAEELKKLNTEPPPEIVGIAVKPGEPTPQE